jgi:hypothetical protein
MIYNPFRIRVRVVERDGREELTWTFANQEYARLFAAVNCVQEPPASSPPASE